MHLINGAHLHIHQPLINVSRLRLLIYLDKLYFINEPVFCDNFHIILFKIITGCDYTILVEAIIQQGDGQHYHRM